MYISELVKRINQKLADETKTQTELIPYMDSVIDDINARLNSKFPTYTEYIRAFLYYNGPPPEPDPEEPCEPPFYNPIPPQPIRPNCPICPRPPVSKPNYQVPVNPDSIHQGQYHPNAMDLDYNLIPDKYQRSVVIVGTAVKIYESDEEGNESATMYKYDYEQQLFYMIRDFSFCIPEQFQEDGQGFVGLSDHDIQSPGLIVPAMPFITGVYTTNPAPPNYTGRPVKKWPLD